MRYLKINDLVGLWRSINPNSKELVFDFNIKENLQYEFHKYEGEEHSIGSFKMTYKEVSNTQIFSLSNYKDIELYMIHNSELVFIIDGCKYFFKKINLD